MVVVWWHWQVGPTNAGLVYRVGDDSGGAAVKPKEVIENLRWERDVLSQQVKELTDTVAQLRAEIQSLNIRGKATSYDWGASDLTEEKQ